MRSNKKRSDKVQSSTRTRSPVCKCRSRVNTLAERRCSLIFSRFPLISSHHLSGLSARLKHHYPPSRQRQVSTSIFCTVKLACHCKGTCLLRCSLVCSLDSLVAVDYEVNACCRFAHVLAACSFFSHNSLITLPFIINR